MSIKKQCVKSLADGISKFEDSKNIVKKSDFSDLKTFLKCFLNTSEKSQRKKSADEFKKRHFELYEFLKENPELVSAEAEIEKIVNFTEIPDKKEVTNLLEMIEESIK